MAVYPYNDIVLVGIKENNTDKSQVCWVKESSSEVCILCDSIYMTVWERQDSGTEKD